MEGAGRVVAIVGASSDRRKFGNQGGSRLRTPGLPWCVPSIRTSPRSKGFRPTAPRCDVPGPIDIVTLYVPARIGDDAPGRVAARQPAEVWINPGAESPALLARARALGLEPILACSIMAIGERPGF